MAGVTRTDAERPLRIVSVSRGSSRRDARLRTMLLGRPLILERIGTDGDLREAAATYARLAREGEVAAFGLGGADLDLVVAGRRYRMRESAALVRHAGSVPVVCGSGLKDTLERRAVAALDARVGWRGKRVLVTSAVDRWGMAEALAEHGAELVLGDFVYALGLPFPMRSLRTAERAARLVAPIAARLPIDWLYPTGTRQETAVAGWRTRPFERAEAIAGDFHFLARYAPADLTGKTILTNTTTAEDVRVLASRGVERLATTTPRIGGRSLPTNLLEAAFTAIAGRHPLPAADLTAMVQEAGLAPDVQELNAPGRADASARVATGTSSGGTAAGRVATDPPEPAGPPHR